MEGTAQGTDSGRSTLLLASRWGGGDSTGEVAAVQRAEEEQSNYNSDPRLRNNPMTQGQTDV